MPIEIKNFNGVMDLDSPNEVIGKGFHRTSRNVWFRGITPNMRAETVPGNVLLENPLIPDDFQNLEVGKYYDYIGKRIFFWNYRPDGANAIYIYNTIPGTFQRLIENGVNAVAGTLNLAANNIVSDIDIIYGDSTQGDILFFLDADGIPKKINIQRALSSGYGTIVSSFMDVAKETSNITPYVVYENDSTVTVNNLRKKLFKFKIRWTFDDNDKSVTSTQSEIPLPYDAFATATDSNPTINCRIAIVYQTGPSNVKSIEILGAVSNGNTFSDFFLISSLNKDAESIPDNDIATFLFYNDQAYNYIDVNESIELFDYVPQAAGAQTTLNGNVLSYGNVQEGYPNLTNFSNGTNTSNIAVSITEFYNGRYFELLTAAQNGEIGFESGNIHIVVRGSVFPSDIYTVYFTDGSDVSYTALAGDDTAAVIAGLAADAITNGFTIVSSGNNDLYISRTNISLAISLIQPNITLSSTLDNSFFSYDWWSRHGFGLVYFDEKERTNGAVYPQSNFSVSSLGYNETGTTNKPIYTASIYHRPPIQAHSYSWVRTKDLSKSNIIQWISDRTFKDTTSSLGEATYAYISIENLNTFISHNPGTPLKYGFSANDRIRFIKLYNGDGTTAQLYTNKDFEIVASVINPTINGIVETGQFIKIILPSTNSTFDFGGTSYANYFIELYTPAQSVANGLDVYYEFGERYLIGNPGTVNAFHQGMLQNQTSNLVTPATFEFTKGDFYIRKRSIQTGQEFLYTISAGFGSDSNAGRITLGCTLTSASYTDPNIDTGNSPFQNLVGFNLATNTTRFILRVNSGTYTFRCKGSIVINFPDDRPFDSYEFFLQKNTGEKIQLVNPFDSSTAGTHSFTFDLSFNMTAGERLFIFGWSVPGYDHTRSFTETTITITRDNSFSQQVIDPNFSDYFPSAINSNGRSYIYDANANQVVYPTMYRWSLAYQQDTNINKTNRFYSTNFDEIDRRFGAIMAMKNWDRMLTFFQERKCGQTGVYQKFITDSGGKSQLLTTDTIIASNNVQYYEGNYGVSNQKTSIIQSGFRYYFYDPIYRRLIRLSKDGLTDLSETYNALSWTKGLSNYLDPGDYPFGGKQRLKGTFNYRPDNTGEVLFMAQGKEEAPGETIAFDEERKGFYGFHDIDCDDILCAENILYFWKNGLMWKQDVISTYANNFGHQYNSIITLVYNENVLLKKIFNALAYKSNRNWASESQGDIETNSINSQTQNIQQSKIYAQDYDQLESPSRYTNFNRDMNSMSNPNIALWEGDYLVGNLVIIKLTQPDGVFSYLFQPYINYEPDPRNG